MRAHVKVFEVKLSVRSDALPQPIRLMMVLGGTGLLFLAGLGRLDRHCDCSGSAYSCVDTRYITCYSHIYNELAGWTFANFMARTEVFVLLVLVGSLLAFYGLERTKGYNSTLGR